MRFFQNYIPGNRTIRQSLFWDYDILPEELKNYPRLVVTRVIKLGLLEDFYAAFDLLGGIDAFARTAKTQVTGLTPKELNFMCHAFCLNKKETQCYKKEQSRKKLLSSSTS